MLLSLIPWSRILAHLRKLDESLPARKLLPLTKQQIAELDRRIKDADSGKTQWISGDKVKASLDALQAKWRVKAEAEVNASRIDWSRSPKKGFVPAEQVLDSISNAFSRQARPAQRKKRPSKASPKLK